MIEPTFSPATPAPEEDVTTALYRAAIGPLNVGYYLPIFTRFEETGRAGISWNNAACVSTLNWLVFRQLWIAALAYAGMVVALVLLVFGIGRLVFDLSDALTMALALGFGLIAFVVPGLFGNALLHRDCRRRMAKALAAHSVVAEACAELLQQASSRRRALWLAGANVAVLLVALLAYLQFSALSSVAVMPQGALEAGHVSVGRTAEPPKPNSLPASESPITPASALASISATVAALPASASASASVPQLAASAAPTPPASAASVPGATTPSVAVATSVPASAALPVPVPVPVPALPSASASASAPVKTASRSVVSVPPAKAPVAAASTSKPLAKATPKKEAEKAEKTEKRAKVPPPAVPSKPAASATSTSDATDKPFFINVGLFAKPENAANAHAKLLEAQLPSVTKALKSSRGPLTRVRVGPFSSQADAQAAAEKIKALQLDAMIVQP